MTKKLQLTLEGAPIAHDPPSAKALKFLREKGYSESDVQRIATNLAADMQFAPSDPDLQNSIFREFVRHFIVPSVDSALANEAQRDRQKTVN